MTRTSSKETLHKQAFIPTWANSAKNAVGCSLAENSRLWFTLSRGIITEVYYPSIDSAAIRDLGMIVTDGRGFFSEEQFHCDIDVEMHAGGIPAYKVINVCRSGRYRLIKEIVVDPARNVLLQRVRFLPSKEGGGLRLFVLLAPRLNDRGRDNSGWAGDIRGREMLFAKRENTALALVATAPWAGRSITGVGEQDAWHQLQRDGKLIAHFDKVEKGYIALAGEIDLSACGGEFILALSLHDTPEAAATHAILSLNESFETIRDAYVRQWREWQEKLKPLDSSEKIPGGTAEQRQRPDRSRPRVHSSEKETLPGVYRTSAMVLRAHRSRHLNGGAVASLTVPWGEARGDDDLGGYHLVWPRDLVEETGGLIAAGVHQEVQSTIAYLRATQKPEGSWPQNMWLNGEAYSEGVQLDEAALPVLLVQLAHQEKALTDGALKEVWPMVRKTGAFIARTGPVTGQDRWENGSGLSPYTLATEVAALLIAAEMADRFGEPAVGELFRETADMWNDSIEWWTYVTQGPLMQRLKIPGYYVRIAPPPGMRGDQAGSAANGDSELSRAAGVVSPDALCLVRFGLRAADDPRILSSIKAIDALTRVELPAGPGWHRYNGDAYGEHDDGTSPGEEMDPGRHGRVWPLLTGERGHYELARGDKDLARKMLDTMAGFGSQIGLLPEQVWDEGDKPMHDLFRGRPSGSAMPLAWAHAEYVRLLRSLADGRVFDCPECTKERYITQGTRSPHALWRFDLAATVFPEGKSLRIQVGGPAVVHFSTDGWRTTQDLPARDTGMGFYVADLPTSRMKPGERVTFTFHWTGANDRWEGRDFVVRVAAVEPALAPPAPVGASNAPHGHAKTRRQP